MSDKKCIICNRPLKANVVDRQPNANLCNTCYHLSKGKAVHEKGEKVDLYGLHVENCTRYGGKVSFVKQVNI